ncbi:MAG: CocE/NonD family hydrolase [Gemmatimonadales bacterium]|nr:CocE/NonD family hydrolase [Gemmatimonadales bacterium]
MPTVGLVLALLVQSAPTVRVDANQMVPMRDGVRLATDVYRPGGAGPWPVILIRTPYNKASTGSAAQGQRLAAWGYAVAIQDVRGKHQSEGIFRVQADDPDDGYDTVDWLARQPWSTGKVGTIGCSYPGEAQIFLAKRRHPAHLAMVPQAAAGPARYLSVINGGAYELALMFGWLRANGSKVHLQPAPGTPDSLVALSRPFLSARQDLPAVDFQAAWQTLPIADMSRRVPGPPTDWEAFVTHGPGDPWWRGFNLLTDADTIATPGLHVGSWYDYGVTETLGYFARFRRAGADARTRDGQYAIIAPTAHCDFERATAETMVGRRPVGDARFDYTGVYRRWFDHWLKAEGNLNDLPRVQYFVMGRGEWRSATDWPVPGTKFTRYYLRSDGRANSRFGTGTLSLDAPGKEPADEFVYDPATPVPSKGGALCCTGTPDAPPGAFDQSDVEARHDVLVYSTPPLTQGVEITGPIEAVLHVSSSATDTDFTVKLVDVYPDGTAYNVQEGILRARYRDGFDRETRMVPGTVYPIRVNVHATSNYFGPGHRIRVEISSSNFPRFDRNLNLGTDNSRERGMAVARNVIHHSARYPSHLVLPIVP